MRYWINTTFLAIGILLGSLPCILPAQAPEKPPGILPLALKVQAYGPLSNLALPFVDRKEDLPFSPRFYVVELEKYFRGGHGVQLSFGGRRHTEKGLRANAINESSGIKGRLSYQKYLHHVERSAFEGWFITAGLSGLTGKRSWSDGVDQGGIIQTRFLAGDVGFGKSLLVKNRLLISLSAGPQFGFQKIVVINLGEDIVTNFDYASIKFGQRKDEAGESFWGLTGYLSCSLGWIFGR